MTSGQAGELRHAKMFIAGQWVDAQDGERFESINPYTGKAWATAPVAKEADVRAAVQAATGFIIRVYQDTLVFGPALTIGTQEITELVAGLEGVLAAELR